MKLTILIILFTKTFSGVWLKATRSTVDIISACTFEYLEETTCQFYNDRSGLDSADWIKYYDKTPSEDTGPERAKGGKYYMYIETSAMKSGENARLISSLLTTDTQLCLSFYSHMFGDSIGELQVIISISGSNNIIFRKSKSQGNYWHYNELYFSPTNNFQIIFNGIDGSSYKGDIALDQILLFSGKCNNYTISIGEPPVTGAITVEEALTLAELISVIAGMLGGCGVTTAIIGLCNSYCERGNEESDYHCICKKKPKPDKTDPKEPPLKGDLTNSDSKGPQLKGDSTNSDSKGPQLKGDSTNSDQQLKRKGKKKRKNKIDVDLKIHVVKGITYPEDMNISKIFHY